MKKTIFLLLMFPLLFIACGSDDDDTTPPDNNVELIYNEPLVSMFGKTLEEVKKAETREIIEETEKHIIFEDKKKEFEYSISYNLSQGNIISLMICTFKYDDNTTNQLNKSIALKYKLKDGSKTIYIAKDKSYILWVTPVSTEIHVIYMLLD